jgi:hypothetical protein
MTNDEWTQVPLDHSSFVIRHSELQNCASRAAASRNSTLSIAAFTVAA